tara:strand:- start:1601 stop:2164 length:564 start_codon:yes stop_codon:yes gene_type:complete
MKTTLKLISLFIFLILFPNVKAAEKIYLYKGTFSRTINIDELYKFKTSKVPSSKLKNLLAFTNQNKDDLYKILLYEIEVPIKTSSKLMNSKIGEVFLSRLSKIVHPNKIGDKKIGLKAIRSGILLSSYKNNQKITLLEFLNSYPNKNIAIDLNALSKALRKAESLKELIEFFSNSPFKKLKDGSSSI